MFFLPLHQRRNIHRVLIFSEQSWEQSGVEGDLTENSTTESATDSPSADDSPQRSSSSSGLRKSLSR